MLEEEQHGLGKKCLNQIATFLSAIFPKLAFGHHHPNLEIGRIEVALEDVFVG